MTYKEYQIVIVGGGNAGISIASKFLLQNKNLEIEIIYPAPKHCY